MRGSGIEARARAAGRWVVTLARELVHEWRADRLSGLAAEMSFFALLSLFPLLLALASMLGSLESVVGEDLTDDAQREVVDGLESVLGPGSEVTEAVSDLFDRASPGVLTIGVLVAVYASSRGFSAVVKALDVAYDLEHPRSWVATKVIGLLLSVGSLVVLVVILTFVVIGPLFGEGADLAEWLGVGSGFATAWDWLRWPAAALVLVAWVTTVFHVAPAHTSPWRWEVPGAVFATVVWLAASLGFRLYLDLTGEGNAVLGVIGGVLSLLTWIYLMSIGLLLGAELNAIIGRRHGVLVGGGPRPPVTDRLQQVARRVRERVAEPRAPGGDR